MIYDRTQIDITKAKKIRDEYVKKFSELTTEQIEQLERGCLTHNTLNRIENKQIELKALFSNLCYFVKNIKTKTWEISDVFYKSDFERILNNLNLLVNAFFVYSNTPNIPNSNLTKYSTINDIEKILVDLEKMINELKDYYRECGNFECGED